MGLTKQSCFILAAAQIRPAASALDVIDRGIVFFVQVDQFFMIQSGSAIAYRHIPGGFMADQEVPVSGDHQVVETHRAGDRNTQ